MISVILADPTGGILTTALVGLSSLASAGAGIAAASKAGGRKPTTPVAAQPASPAAQPAAPPTSLTNTQGPSFMAAAAAPPQVNQPGKTLLGQ